jgi:hypothetical protein
MSEKISPVREGVTGKNRSKMARSTGSRTEV